MIGGRHRSNAELVAQGVANSASALFGGLPATGAIARTATNVRAGARSPIAGMVHAALLLVFMLVLAPWMRYVPLAALAAVLLVVAWNISEVEAFRHTLSAPKGDRLVLLLTFFLTVFFATLGFAFVESFFFIGYLVSIALFGLYQAVFMANAGGAWDNAKKIVETELKQKGTELHDATVVGDTVGDPFKDTSSVAMNPAIKFTTLFGLLAAEVAIEMGSSARMALAAIAFALALVFVWRTFYAMRIKDEPEAKAAASGAARAAAH